jgi:hypothetical protein
MKKVTIPCSCGCSVVTVVEFDEIGDNPREFFADFYTMALPPFGSRLKTAWKVFRRREHWIHDVHLDEEGLRELRDYLNEILKEDKHVESI